MRISQTMSLDHLAERMGRWADRNDAWHMRETLVSIGAWEDTSDVSELDWSRAIESSIRDRIATERT